MSSKNVGIEEARKTLGDLVTAAQQGAEIVLTRNGKPAARIVRYQEATMPNIRYATRQNVIDEVISPALDGEYDIDAIFSKCFTWKIDTNERGQELLNTAGFEQTVTSEEFWVIAAEHEIG